MCRCYDACNLTGLMGKSKAHIMRVVTVLHALFHLGYGGDIVTDASIKAAINLVDVCNEHARIFAGRMDTTSGANDFKYYFM